MEVLRSIRSGLTGNGTGSRILRVYAGDIVSKAISVLSALILIRALPLGDYGQFVAFNGIALLVPGVIGSGINAGLVRYSAEFFSLYRFKPHRLYRSALVLELGCYLVAAAMLLWSPPFSSRIIFGTEAYAHAVELGIIGGIGVLLLQLGRSTFQAEERFTIYVVSLWLRELAVIGVLGGLWAVGALTFTKAALTQTVVQVLLGLLLLRFGLERSVGAAPVAAFEHERRAIAGFFRAMGWLIAYFFVLALFGQLDLMVLSRFWSEQYVAIYGVALKYYGLALLMLGSINATLLPRFARVDMQDASAQRAFLFKWLRISVWVAVPILLFNLFGQPVFDLVNGVAYAESFRIFNVFSVGIWFSLVLSPLVNVVIGRSMFRFLCMAGLLGLVVAASLNLALVPRWGGFGASIAIVAAHAVINVTCFVYVLLALNKSVRAAQFPLISESPPA